MLINIRCLGKCSEEEFGHDRRCMNEILNFGDGSHLGRAQEVEVDRSKGCGGERKMHRQMRYGGGG
jgi:hypothetical protein